MGKRVTISFEDYESLTNKEIESNLRGIYGNNADIEITPSSKTPESYIGFGISQLITEDQALIFFDQPEQYENKLKALRHEVVKKVMYVLNDVIMENEEKFSG